MKKLFLNQIELATVDQGTGATVVLVHGFPLDHRMWQAQIDALSSRFRVIAPDLRGFGQSGITEGQVGMPLFADDLAALLDALAIHEPVILGGLSMGGYVAWEFWRRHRTRLRAMLLCDTRAAADSPEVAAGRLATAERVLREGPGFLATTMLPRLFAEENRQPEASFVTATRDVILSTAPQGIAAAARGMAERADFTSLLGQIDVPILFLVGEHDVITSPGEMYGLAGAVADAQFAEISGAGHMAPLENSAEANAAILAFLADITGSEPTTGS